MPLIATPRAYATLAPDGARSWTRALYSSVLTDLLARSAVRGSSRAALALALVTAAIAAIAAIAGMAAPSPVVRVAIRVPCDGAIGCALAESLALDVWS